MKIESEFATGKPFSLKKVERGSQEGRRYRLRVPLHSKCQTIELRPAYSLILITGKYRGNRIFESFHVNSYSLEVGVLTSYDGSGEDLKIDKTETWPNLDINKIDRWM